MEQKKWYDNKIAVYLLFAIFLLPIFYGCGSKKEKPKNELQEQSKSVFKQAITKLVLMESFSIDSSLKIIDEFSKILIDSTELGYKYAMYWDSIAKHAKPMEISQKLVSEKQAITFQEYFLEQKAELYNSDYLNAKNDAAKMLFQKKTEKLTKQLLDSTSQTLTNWVGTISRVSLAYGHNQRDMELLKTMSPNAVIEKYPEGRDINIYIVVGEKELNNATYLAEVYQEFNPKKNVRGIKPNSSLYETVLDLKEGQQVIFSAKVKRTMDTNGKNNEQFTGFNIELTEIKPAK